jgi:hypothetical protein
MVWEGRKRRNGRGAAAAPGDVLGLKRHRSNAGQPARHRRLNAPDEEQIPLPCFHHRHKVPSHSPATDARELILLKTA